MDDAQSPAVALTDRRLIALLILAAVVPFAWSLGFGYVLDDTTAIRSNPDLNGWGSLFRVWTHRYGGEELPFYGLYRPLTMTLFAFVWNAGGGYPVWFHVLALAMHATATVLVWRLLERGIRRAPALLATLWFAVHPVHVEAVANIANSSEVLVAIWTCALVLLLLRIDASGGRVSWRHGTAAGALYLAAFLTKESGAVAPILAALSVWGWRDDPEAAGPKNTARLLVHWRPVLVGWAAAALLVIVLRALVLGGPVTGETIAATGIDELTGTQRVWAMLSLGRTILGLLVWPPVLNPHYGPTTFPQTGASVWAAATLIVLAAGVAAAVWLAKKGDRRVVVAIAWILVAFLPASNLLVATGQILAERTLYVPSIGVAMLIGLGLDAARSGQRARVAWAPGAAIVVFLTAWSALRTTIWTGIWRNHETLFAQMIVADKAGYVGYWFSGMYQGRNGRMDQALVLLDRAYTRYQKDPGLLRDYADALIMQGKPTRAVSVAARLVALPKFRDQPPAVALYLDALGRAYGADSVVAAARRLMDRAPSATAALFLGHAHEVRKDTAAAARAYAEGLRLSPKDTALQSRLNVLRGKR